LKAYEKDQCLFVHGSHGPKYLEGSISIGKIIDGRKIEIYQTQKVMAEGGIERGCNRIKSGRNWIVVPHETIPNTLHAINIKNPGVTKKIGLALRSKIVNIIHVNNDTFILSTSCGQHCTVDVNGSHFEDDKPLSLQEILHVFAVQDSKKFKCLVKWGIEPSAFELIQNTDSKSGNGIMHLCAFSTNTLSRREFQIFSKDNENLFQNNWQQTPLSLAIESQQTEMIDSLRTAARDAEDVPSLTTADLVSLMNEGLYLESPFTNFFEDPGSSLESFNDAPFPLYGVIKGSHPQHSYQDSSCFYDLKYVNENLLEELTPGSKVERVEIVRSKIPLNLEAGSQDSIDFLGAFKDFEGAEYVESDLKNLIDHKYQVNENKILVYAMVNIMFVMMHVTLCLFFLHKGLAIQVLKFMTYCFIGFEGF
jgi:hypothetical protein